MRTIRERDLHVSRFLIMDIGEIRHIGAGVQHQAGFEII
jgi:hypothetical protein